jgi:hypothetical protein
LAPESTLLTHVREEPDVGELIRLQLIRPNEPGGEGSIHPQAQLSATFDLGVQLMVQAQGCALTPLCNRPSRATNDRGTHKEAAQTRCPDSGEETPSRPHPQTGWIRLGWQVQRSGQRSAGQEPVWWAWLDLNQRPHPYQACSRDAFMLVRRGRPAQRSDGSDRGCPLDTVVVRLMWHASGTVGENGDGSHLTATATSSSWGLGPTSATHRIDGKPPEEVRQNHVGCSGTPTCCASRRICSRA